MKRANEMEIPDFQLSDQERDELRLRWYKDIVPHADIHERHFLQQSQNL
jgi:tRNA (guanosine-2'-O-)-methyltransferase